MWDFIDGIVFWIQSSGVFLFRLIFADQPRVPGCSEKILAMHIAAAAN